MMIDEARMTKLLTPNRIWAIRPLKKPRLISIAAVVTFEILVTRCLGLVPEGGKEEDMKEAE